jgi:hypothetical protein
LASWPLGPEEVYDEGAKFSWLAGALPVDTLDKYCTAMIPEELAEIWLLYEIREEGDGPDERGQSLRLC